MFEPMNFVRNLIYMGRGMLGIMAVMAVVIITVVILNKIFSTNNK